MPKRHCAVIKSGDSPHLKLGIWRVFDPWVDPHLQLLQGHAVPAITRPLLIEFHFRRVVRRLVRSLGRLYQSVRDWDRFLEAGGLASTSPELSFEIPEEAGIAADSVFHYLNLFIDDLARITFFVLAQKGVKTKEPDGFNELRGNLVNSRLQASRTLIELFAELESKDSWWHLGFRRGVGMRQRLTHYTDLIIFKAATKPGDTKMTADISLSTIGGPVQVADFEDSLKSLINNLCEWLDKLDIELLNHLSESMEREGVFWKPFDEPCPVIVLPEIDEAILNGFHYLYIPLCGKV